MLNFVPMDTPKLLFSLLCFFLLGHDDQQHVVEGSRLSSPFGSRPNMLFVFGDSYADTGNNNKALTSSWKLPYGITFPGKPSGRFSDGAVLTDFVAKHLRINTPIPYRYRKELSGRVKYGMNFACGGTGVFDTLAPEPNMTTQIHFFEQLLKDSIYSERVLKTSVAHVSLSGNDYSNYISNNGPASGLPAFIASVVNQLKVNLRRIHNTGVRKIGVGALQPLGCLPRSTALFAFEQCNKAENDLVDLHNQLLVQAVNDLNNETNSSSFFVLDIYNAFWNIFNQKHAHHASPTFENPFEPCCVGVSAGFSCGSVDQNGVKQYTVCSNPKSKFFWDTVHPTQEGWRAVYSTQVLQNSLGQFW